MTAWLYFLSTCLMATAFGEDNDTWTVFQAIDDRIVNYKISRHEWGLFSKDMDCNRDDIISTAELVCMFKDYNIGPSLPAFILSADVDADGLVTSVEYWDFFDAMDTNDNSRVSWGEFQTAWIDFEEGGK